MDEIKGKRTEGWLLATPVKRIEKKSKFLRDLEKKQAAAQLPPPPENVVDIKKNKKS